MSSETELQLALRELRDLDDRLGEHGHLIDSCAENLRDAGDPEPDHRTCDDAERAAWVRRLIASVESEAECIETAL